MAEKARPLPKVYFCFLDHKDMPAFKRPMSLEELQKLADEDGYITDTLKIDLYDIVDHKAFDNLVETRMVKKELVADASLFDIQWAIKGFSPDGHLWFQIVADASQILEKGVLS